MALDKIIESGQLNITVDKTFHCPAYLQVFNQMVDAIRTGTLSPGQELPPVRDLSVSLGLTMVTISRAYQKLTNDGYIKQSKGRLSTVSLDPPISIAASRFVNLARTEKYSDEQIIDAIKNALQPNK